VRVRARVTTDYSAAELGNLLNAANRVKKSRNDPAAADCMKKKSRK
jgi:hypothetical protein